MMENSHSFWARIMRENMLNVTISLASQKKKEILLFEKKLLIIKNI